MEDKGMRAVCDNKECDFIVHFKTIDEAKKHVNLPCPKCGEIYLAEGALEMHQGMLDTIKMFEGMIKSDKGPKVNVTIRTRGPDRTNDIKWT